MSEKLIIHNIDGTTTEVEPLKAWDPRETCPNCGGSGQVMGGGYCSDGGVEICKRCRGTGLVWVDSVNKAS